MLLALFCASLSSYNPLSSTEPSYLFLLNSRETQEQGRQGPEESVVNQVSGYVYVTTDRAHRPSIVVLASDSQPLTVDLMPSIIQGEDGHPGQEGPRGFMVCPVGESPVEWLIPD